MTTKVQKWGNSLAVRLPKMATLILGLKRGSLVSIIANDKGISIKPTLKREETLRDMIKKINKNNIHSEIDWGVPVGKEIW